MSQISPNCQIDKFFSSLDKTIAAINSCQHPGQLPGVERMIASFSRYFTWTGQHLDPINSLYWAFILAWGKMYLAHQLQQQKKILKPTVIVETALSI